MTETQKLLAEYVRSASEAAFRELVARYLGLVHSSALRLVGGNVQLAQDVAQTVFVALAQKAKKLPANVALGGWLHQHTCFTAATLMRSERRRQLRETQAAEMNIPDDHDQTYLGQVAPVLDEAIGQLKADDRTAILLRFFEQQDLRSVGEALGSTEDAARKRVARALDKLHVLLTARGVTISVATLTTILATEAVTAAPPAMIQTIACSALESPAVGGSSTLAKLLTPTKAKLSLLGLAAAGALVLLQFLTVPPTAPQQGTYKIEGVVQFENIAPSSPNAPTNWEVPFIVQVQGRRWRIDLPPCQRHPDSSYVYVFDGNQTFCLNSFPAAIEKLRASGRPVAANVAEGRIHTLPLPRDMNVPEASLLWLTYCSESELSSAAPGQFVPVFAYGGGVQIFDETKVDPQKSYWTQAAASPRLPRAFTTVLRYPDWFAQEMRKHNADPSATFTNVTFWVESITNTAAMEIPARAEAKLFKVGVAESRPSLTMRALALRVSNAVDADLSKPPQLPGPTAITDERLGPPGVSFQDRLSWVTGLETRTTQVTRQVLKSVKSSAQPTHRSGK